MIHLFGIVKEMVLQEAESKTKKTSRMNIDVNPKDIQTTLSWLDSKEHSIPEDRLPIIKAGLYIAEKMIYLSSKYKILRKTLDSIFNHKSKSEKSSNDLKNGNHPQNTQGKSSSETSNSSDQAKEESKSPNPSPGKPIINPNEKNKSKYHRVILRRKMDKKEKNKKKNEEESPKKKRKSKKDDKLSTEAEFTPFSQTENGTDTRKKQVDRTNFSSMDKPYLRSETNERKVINIKFVVEEITLQVETVTNTLTGERVTATVEEAPPYCSYTYQTILFLIHQHVEYSIPLHRLERMYSHLLGVSRSTIFRFCNYVAQAFLPIYIHLFKELINKASIIQMDDTKTRILKEAKEEDFKDTEEDLVIDEKNNIFKGLVDPNICIHKKLNDEIGLLSYKSDDKALKKTNLTFMTGETIKGLPESRISIFLTHFGQAGDLLDKLLPHRDKKSPRLDIVSDLASFNRATLENIQKYNIHTNGCSSHARRNFWNARDLGDEMYYALRCFHLLYTVEDITNGKSKEDILRYRQKYSKKIWEHLIWHCENVIIPKWPKDSAPRKAAKYITKNKVELMSYLKDPDIPIDNNRSERGIRPEKVMLSGSKFRYNSEGRAIFDILRTFMTICRHARVDWYLYATDILMNRDKIALDPGYWTPFAWKQRH